MMGAISSDKCVFLCYARADALAVKALQEALEAAGIRVWRDTADLWPGEDWRQKIRRAISDDAMAFVACFSQGGLERGRAAQFEELSWAVTELARRRPGVPWLIPVRLDDCDLPDLDIGGGKTLASLQRADVFGERREQETIRLVAAVRRVFASASPDSSTEAQPNPADLQQTASASSARHPVLPDGKISELPRAERVDRSGGGDTTDQGLRSGPHHFRADEQGEGDPPAREAAGRRWPAPPARRQWRPRAGIAVAVAVVLAGLFPSLYSLTKRNLFHPGSAARPPLGVIAEPVTLNDQGFTMATANSGVPDDQILHMMPEPQIAASPKFIAAIRAAGGVNVEASTIRLLVSGHSRQGIRIVSIEPVALHRTAPLSGTLYLIPSQGAEATLRMMFDLDELDPIARKIGGTADPGTHDPRQELAGFIRGLRPGSDFFEDQTIHLRYNEQQGINLRMQITHWYATFDLEIDYYVGTSSDVLHKLILQNDGHPFSITGVPSGPTPETASYRRAYESRNWSMCQILEPAKIPLGPTAVPPPCR
jgi:TIR domain